jgi:acid phosphatase
MTRRLLATALAAAGITLALPAAPAVAAANPVVVIVMENQSFSSIVGSAQAPFINDTMIGGGTLETTYRANVSTSLRDYLAMTAGIVDQGSAAHSDNIFNQLQAAGTSWAEYEESMPSPCYTGSSAGSAPGTSDPLYTSGHNPAVHFLDITSQKSVCRSHVLPYSAFDPHALPAFSYVVPNQCDDMHSRCKGASQVTHGDDWLSDNVPPMVGAGATVVLTWDEGGGGGGQHIATVVYGSPGPARDSHSYNHFNLLAGLEQRFGLDPLNGAEGRTPVPIP